MTKYPNREALRKAHDIYRDAMRGFVVRCLKKIQGTTPEKELCRILKLKLIDDPKVAIDINDFPRIIRDRVCWFDAFSSLFGSRGDMDIRGMTSVISDSRKLWAHPGTEDVDSDSIQMYLSLIAEVLDGINETDAGHEVKTIRDRLFSNEPEEHPAEVENADLKKRLAEMSNQLKTTNVIKTKLEKRLDTTSTRLENVEGELDDRKKDLTRNLRQLKVVETENTKLKKRLPPKPVPSNDMPDSITFHGTTFTKHFEEYYAEEDEITQTFWHYWHSQGPEGKEEMQDAGWSVEQVNGDWEVVVSPEDLQAWIGHEVTELSSLLNSWQDEETSKQSTRLSAALRQFTQLSATLRQSIPLSSEKTSLPTGEEMEQPALEFLSDRREHRRVKIIDHLSEHFSLTGDQRSYLSKTGKAEKHLMKEGLIERTRDGYYRITAHGFRYQKDLDDTPF